MPAETLYHDDDDEHPLDDDDEDDADDDKDDHDDDEDNYEDENDIMRMLLTREAPRKMARGRFH